MEVPGGEPAWLGDGIKPGLGVVRGLRGRSPAPVPSQEGLNIQTHLSMKLLTFLGMLLLSILRLMQEWRHGGPVFGQQPRRDRIIANGTAADPVCEFHAHINQVPPS